MWVVVVHNCSIIILSIIITNNNDSEILSTSITPSEGFHNDVVVNLIKASHAIRSCISSAEKKAKLSFFNIKFRWEIKA